MSDDSDDFFEKLADLRVAEPPPEFNHELGQRLNRLLLAQHLIDFTLGAIPSALVGWLRSVTSWFVYTLTGKY